jgi:hypothetical protein
MATTDTRFDFTDEDTEIAPEPRDHRRRMTGDADQPSCELVWVEEDGLGMVLRVRPLPRPSK